MSTNNIDDLFRRQLGNHETPPGDDLWARLQAGPDAAPPADTMAGAPPERLDQLFQQRLHGHTTPPARQTWERLEDGYLRPRKRRAAAWWPMSMAAAVLILLLAGGVSLWRSSTSGRGAGNKMAVQQKATPATVAPTPAAETATAGATKPADVSTASAAATAATLAAATAVAAAPALAPAVATATGQEAPTNVFSVAPQKNIPLRATRAQALASTAPKTRNPVARPVPRQLPGSRQPAAAAPALAARPAAPAPTTHTAADEPQPAPVVAANTSPSGPLPATAAAGSTAAAGFIAVEVRSGPAPVRPAAASVSALASVDAPAGRQRLGGRLLKQAGHLVRGERLSLAEVTGLPENVTIQATVAGYRVTKSIQL